MPALAASNSETLFVGENHTSDLFLWFRNRISLERIRFCNSFKQSANERGFLWSVLLFIATFSRNITWNKTCLLENLNFLSKNLLPVFCFLWKRKKNIYFWVWLIWNKIFYSVEPYRNIFLLLLISWADLMPHKRNSWSICCLSALQGLALVCNTLTACSLVGHPSWEIWSLECDMKHHKHI